MDSQPCEMDISAVHLKESISPEGTLGEVHVGHDAGCSIKIPPEFVNHGLMLWNQNRQQWIERKKSKPLEAKSRTLALCSSRKCWFCVWEPNQKSMLSSNKPFRRPIPLSEMVNFLVDIWEEEGLWD